MTDTERLTIATALLAVVALMDESDTARTVKVFRRCMPSIAPLFTDADGDALYLDEAVRRFLDGGTP